MNILNAAQFKRQDIENLFELADQCQSWFESRSWEIKGDPCLSSEGRPYYFAMASLFMEPSLRTRFSFELAHQKLGGVVVTADDVQSTSQAKGESLEDTIRTASQLADVICLRSPRRGAAEAAAAVSRVPVINCGDGANEHPTQALLDLYTIWRQFGKIDGLNILFFGDDYHYTRTVKSLRQVLGLYEVNVSVELSYSNGPIPNDGDWRKRLATCDVLYVTRPQKERWPQGNTFKDRGISISFNELNQMKENAIVMHPGPRNGEINPQIDNEPKMKMWDQVRNGMYMRMAVLKTALGHI